MELNSLLFGLVIGGIIGFLLGKIFFGKASQKTKELHLIQTENARIQERFNGALNEVNAIKEERDSLRQTSTQALQNLASLEAERKALQQRLEEQKTELTALQENFSSEFKVLADKILKENTREFLDTNNKNIGDILKPLKEKIEGFEKKVQETYINETKDRARLFEEIKTLSNLNEEMRADAKNLTRALKGDNKQQGNWGELILEKILEGSGLQKGQEYQVQGSFTDETGKRLMPDVIINLPDEKHIIVDSKVTLVAYERFVNSIEDGEREIALKQHTEAVKKHITDLSGKNYPSIHQINPPDFVLLFMPIESAFIAAVQADRGLFNYAWERQIVIVSPSTLMATLRTIGSTWKIERQNQNVQEIARQGGAMYEKFIGFLNDMEKIKKGIDTSSKAYEDAFNKLSTGTGNLVRRADSLKKLGAKTEKSLDPALIEKAAD